MRQQHIEAAALCRDTMTSPYLDSIRSTRKIIEDLISSREVELAKAMMAAQRKRIEEDLAFLRDELARKRRLLRSGTYPR